MQQENLTPGQLFDKNVNLAYDYIHDHKILIDGYELNDLYQVALLALWKACSTYKPELSQFSTYAVNCIKNEFNGLIRKEHTHSRSGHCLSLDGLKENTPDGLDPDYHTPVVDSFEDVIIDKVDIERIPLSTEDKIYISQMPYFSDSYIKHCHKINSRRLLKSKTQFMEQINKDEQN